MAENRPSEKQFERNQSGRTAQGQGTEGAADMGRTGVHAAQEAMNETTGAFGRSAASVMDATRRMQNGAATLAEQQHRIGQEASERMADSTRRMADLARTSSEDLRLLMALPSAAGSGAQEMHRSLNGLLEGVIRSNLRMTEEMMRLGSPAAMIDIQRRFINDYLGALMEGSVNILRVIQQTSERSLEPLEAHLEQR